MQMKQAQITTYTVFSLISFVILSFVLIKAFTGHIKEVETMTWVVAGLFVIRIIIGILS